MSSAAVPGAKKFINKAEDVVDEMIEGLLLVEPAQLKKLQGHKVLVRADVASVKEKQVTIVCGGGSGHEPAFAGYVGEGMLTAAVCGGVFASPPASAVLAALRACTGSHGCLVLVMNYTGDRLNFGMAVEQAKAEGLKVQMHVVADDCALPRDKGITGRRGVAGTVLVAKVAGAAAEAGRSLGQVLEETSAAASNVGTLGVALTTCTLPGKAPSGRLDASTIEVGLGIHGEPGMEKTPLLAADELADKMLAAVVDKEEDGGQGYLPLDPGQEVSLLVNSLGGTPTMELLVLARRVVREVARRTGAVVSRCYAGHFMTSLDMCGASVTVMRVDPLVLARLDAPSDALAWRGALGTRAKRPPNLPELSMPVPPPPAKTVAAAATGVDGLGGGEEGAAARVYASAGNPVVLAKAVTAVCEALLAAEPKLTEWDAIAGDGDCGETVKRGAQAVLACLRGGSLLGGGSEVALESLLGALADSVGESMGGTLGAILRIFFSAGRAAAVAAASSTSASAASPPAFGWAEAFTAGTEAVRFYGGAERGMRTVLDALLPAANSLQAPGGDASATSAAAAAAEEGAESTRGMAGLAGRANYVSAAALEGVPDPGAMAAAVAMRAVADALS